MGSVHRAYCECGFSEDVTVGGGRHTFLNDSSFPFYCRACGLVSVNVAKLPDDVVSTSCPECGESDCRQYGTPPVSLVDLRPKPWWKFPKKSSTNVGDSAAIQWGHREATEHGHFCPKCKEMSMRFSNFPELMFD